MAKNPNYLNSKTVFCCSNCGREVSIRVNEGDYMGYYRDGDSSEEAFPYLTEKERLNYTGITWLFLRMFYHTLKTRTKMLKAAANHKGKQPQKAWEKTEIILFL